MLKNHFLPNVLHTILFLEDWFTGKALLGLNNEIDKKPNKLLKDTCMSETITNAFKTLQTFILKKKISFKKLTSITCSNKVKTLKNKKQFVDP